MHLNSAEFDADDSKIVFALAEFNALLSNEKLFINELGKAVTDTNLYQLCFTLESYDTHIVPGVDNIVLPAILLYCNKL